MKKVLKFLILSLGLAVAQGAVAVVLPNQSYVPSAAEYFDYASDSDGNVRIVGVVYSRLGDGDAGIIESTCTKLHPDTDDSQKALCTQCCSDKEEEYVTADPDNRETYEADAKSCRAACAAYSLPLDGGIYLIFALAVAFGAAKAAFIHKKNNIELTMQCCNA